MFFFLTHGTVEMGITAIVIFSLVSIFEITMVALFLGGNLCLFRRLRAGKANMPAAKPAMYERAYTHPSVWELEAVPPGSRRTWSARRRSMALTDISHIPEA